MTQAYLGYLRDAVLKLKKFAPRATGKNPAILISSPSGRERAENFCYVKSVVIICTSANLGFNGGIVLMHVCTQCNFSKQWNY